MATIALAALLLVAAPAPANDSPAGLYEPHRMQMGRGLERQPNGRFRYALTYGAVDEDGADLPIER